MTLPVHFVGVVLGPSGFAAEGRQWLACCETAGLAPALLGARLGDLDAPLPQADAERIARCGGRARRPFGIDWHHMLPQHFVPLAEAGHTVLHTVFETDTLPFALADRVARADTVVVLTEWNRQGCMAGGVPANKLVVLPPPIDAGAVPARSPRRDDAPFRWLSVFDWTLRKGPDLLLAAFARAFVAGEAELHIKTVPHAGRAKGILQEQANALVRRAARGRPPRVTVHEHVCDDATVLRLYADADGFALASRGEAWGRPVHEAMLCELPVVVPAAHACATLVPGDAYGFPVPARRVPVSLAAQLESPLFAGQWWHEVDVDAFAAAMRAVVADPAQARVRAQRARTRITALCDPVRIATELRRLLAVLPAAQPR
jgi:glycosyltransferase involved in cell wall biosynthesis